MEVLTVFFQCIILAVNFELFQVSLQLKQLQSSAYSPQLLY